MTEYIANDKAFLLVNIVFRFMSGIGDIIIQVTGKLRKIGLM